MLGRKAAAERDGAGNPVANVSGAWVLDRFAATSKPAGRGEPPARHETLAIHTDPREKRKNRGSLADRYLRRSAVSCIVDPTESDDVAFAGLPYLERQVRISGHARAPVAA